MILRECRPKLVGQLWHNYYGASAMSVLIRLARLNYLGAGDIRDALGIVIRRRVDLFALMTNDDQRLKALTDSQEFDSEFTEALHPSWWWPFLNSIPLEALGWSLRICPQCMTYAYHSLLFQMPGIDRCPWHGCALVRSCCRCGKSLLDGFDQGGELMQCSCGHDHVNDEAALAGDSINKRRREAAIAQYRSWCVARQRKCWLIAPEIFDSHGWKAVSALVDYPPSNTKTPEGLILDQVNCSRHRKSEISATSGLEKFTPTMVSLPLQWLHDIRAISRRLAQMMPPGKLTLAERRALDPVALHEADRGCEADRPLLLNLPGHVVGKVALLHTSPIDGISIRTLGRLARGLDDAPHYATEPANRRAFRKWIRTDPRGLALLESAIRRVLCRGYADGGRTLLGQIHPDLFRDRTTRPARRFPWVEFRLVDEPIVRVAWTRQINV